MIYRATYGFNVRRYITRDIEADSDDAAEAIAKAEAWGDIDAEVERFANLDDFADTAELDAYLMLDRMDGHCIAEEICAEPLADPQAPATAQQAAA